MTPLWLRIIQVNDVYELDALPNLKTLIDEHSNGPHLVLPIVAGDFIGPSLLSSLDQGVGMVDVLNAIGITHVCFGNHEADISSQDLAKRIQQSNFVWVNTNMQELNDKIGVQTPTHDIVVASNGSLSKRVGLLGLLTNDPAIYRPGSFADARTEPIVEATATFDCFEQADLWIPITHQLIADDRVFMQRFGGERFPIVLGGHEHEVFDEMHHGSRVIKTGQDAATAAIIDIQWHSQEDDRPIVSVSFKATADYAPHPAVHKRVESHKSILRELERSILFRTAFVHARTGLTFSTVNNRLGPSTGTTAFCNMIRIGMRCHCAMINAGSVRGNKEYATTDDFTWYDLKDEIPFPTLFVCCRIPGHVIEACVQQSRAGSRLDPPVASGGFIHTCNNVVYGNKGSVVSIQGKAFNPDRLYLTSLPLQFLQGMDNHEPLLTWAAQANFRIDPELAVPAKIVIVQALSSLLWLRLGSFHDLDVDHDGRISREEVRQRIDKIYGQEVSDFVVDSIFSVADLNGDGTISATEMVVVEYAAMDSLNHFETGREQLQLLRDIAARVVGKDSTHPDVDKLVHRIRAMVDVSGDGKFRREKIMEALGNLKHQELLA